MVLEGGDVQHDLRMFVEDLSATARQAIEQVEEPMQTVDGSEPADITSSSRTVARWRRQGVGGSSVCDWRAHEVRFLPSRACTAVCFGPSTRRSNGVPAVSATD